MNSAQIDVRGLSKIYRVAERGEGLGAALASFVRRTYRDVEAVREVSFQIEPGEMVGFIGPNGAGKTTTLKILAGLLYPTSGEVKVGDFVPWERKNAYLRTISMVLGNKTQMIWDIPPLDSFRVLAEIYQVEKRTFRETLDELIDLLDLSEILTKPVRTLSLGERMKCELVAGLLYRPQVLFLDEPTLGLDVSMQNRLRAFFKEYNRRSGATVILTSHYMADVTALCPRVILIHQGRLLYDGALSGMAARLAPFKTVRVTLADETRALNLNGFEREVNCVPETGGVYSLRVAKDMAPAVTAGLLQVNQLADLTVEDPPIEAVIDQVYQEGSL